MPVRKERYIKIIFNIQLYMCTYTYTHTPGKKALCMIQSKEGTAVLEQYLQSVNLQVFDSGKFPWQRKISGRFKDPIEIHPASRHSPPRPLKRRQWMNTSLRIWTRADSLGTALHIPAASPVSHWACGDSQRPGERQEVGFSQGLVNSPMGYKLGCSLNQNPSVFF